jgi:hypothetical protein
MRNRIMAQAALMMAALVLAVTAQTQTEQRGPGQRMYDPKTEVTFKGTVDDVTQQSMDSMCPGMGTGTHLTVKSGSETYQVHVGPTSFLDAHKYSFKKGDQVEVTGSKVKIEGNDAIIAREIHKDGVTMNFRSAQGVPVWSRGNARRGPGMCM